MKLPRALAATAIVVTPLLLACQQVNIELMPQQSRETQAAGYLIEHRVVHIADTVDSGTLTGSIFKVEGNARELVGFSDSARLCKKAGNGFTCSLQSGQSTDISVDYRVPGGDNKASLLQLTRNSFDIPWNVNL